MANFAGTNNKIIWQTISVHGNTVYLYEEDWNHAVEGHPEMAGQEELVKSTIEKPLRTREGRFPDSCAFDGPMSTNPEGVRVLVRHDREVFLQGGTDGHVTTAFPINTKRYARTRVGSIIEEYSEKKEK